MVSGEIDPDSYVIKRSYNDDQFEIVSKVVGNKKYKIQMGAATNLEKVAVSTDELCLSDENILTLTKIGVILEKLYGSGRDIEWATKNVRKKYSHLWTLKCCCYYKSQCCEYKEA